MSNRERSNRDLRAYVRLTKEEYDSVQERMEQAGIENMAGYFRKMALDGYIIVLNLPELREMIALLRRSSNNLNQLTKRVHETNRFYDKDLEELQRSQEQLWDATQVIVKKLSDLL